jgi:membrane protein implicated in regulation of membrane protease activity
MLWSIWVIAGVALLVAELTFISAEFYLLFVGIAAVLTGLCTALNADMPSWAPWTLFIVLTLAGVKFFRRGLAERFRVKGVPPPGLSAIGQSVLLNHNLPPLAEGRVEFRGASWGIRNRSDSAIPAGSHADIVAIEGLTLIVEPQARR